MMHSKDSGQPTVGKLRPIMLLNCKMKWPAGVLNIASYDIVAYVVMSEQKGFIKGHVGIGATLVESGRAGILAEH